MKRTISQLTLGLAMCLGLQSLPAHAMSSIVPSYISSKEIMAACAWAPTLLFAHYCSKKIDALDVHARNLKNFPADESTEKLKMITDFKEILLKQQPEKSYAKIDFPENLVPMLEKFDKTYGVDNHEFAENFGKKLEKLVLDLNNMSTIVQAQVNTEKNLNSKIKPSARPSIIAKGSYDILLAKAIKLTEELESKFDLDALQAKQTYFFGYGFTALLASAAATYWIYNK